MPPCLVAAGWVVAAVAVAVAWRAVARLRVVRAAGLAAVAEAYAWRERAAEAEHDARAARAAAERVRQSYARVIGRARATRCGPYPAPAE